MVDETLVEVFVNDAEDGEPTIAVLLVNPGMIERDGELFPAIEMDPAAVLEFVKALMDRADAVVRGEVN